MPVVSIRKKPAAVASPSGPIFIVPAKDTSNLERVSKKLKEPRMTKASARLISPIPRTCR